MANNKRECKFCNLKFEPSCGAQKFCSEECRIRYNNSLRRKSKKTAKDKLLPLAEICKRARKEGMTYGQYVAREKMCR